MPLHLVIANKRYSSWSLRAWLTLAYFEIPFTETLIPLDEPDTHARILEVSPSGRVPCLIDGPIRIWESLAIIEYLAERFPEHPVWPRSVGARAHARAISSEMHAGFMALRSACPMNLGRRFLRADRGGEAAKLDVARLERLWRDARATFADDRPFLFGPFSAADAMFAPVVTRLDRYDIEVAPDTRAYMDAVLALPAMLAWTEAAEAETMIVPSDEVE